jgi:hypothetical protein
MLNRPGGATMSTAADWSFSREAMWTNLFEQAMNVVQAGVGVIAGPTRR